MLKTAEVLRNRIATTALHRTLMTYHQDLTQPISAFREALQIGERARNLAKMQVRHSLGQRTNIRFGAECSTRLGESNGYRRLRHCAVVLSCPDPEQAELAIEAILAFAQSLDGIWLAPPPAPEEKVKPEPMPAPAEVADDAMLAQDAAAAGLSAEDLQAISDESADLQEP